MNKFFLMIAGLFGATGVALGALGAHYLRDQLAKGLIEQRDYDAFDTATKYQLFHALALLMVFFLNQDKKFRWLTVAANLFVIGIILFSGSIYFLSTQKLWGTEAMNFLGPITPIGGLALIGGWACLVVYALSLGKNGNAAK